MKAIFLVALIACAAATPVHVLSEENMDDLAYFDGVLFSMWNGFVRGLYREHTQTVIDKECLGEWVQKNLTHLDDVMSRIFDLSFDITFEEAKEAAIDGVNLFYKNKEFCKLDKVFTDLTNFCGDMECLDENIFTNI